MLKHSLFASAAILSVLPYTAFAHQSDRTTSASENREKTDDSQDDDFHINRRIVVTAPFIKDLNILAGTSELSGDILTRETRAQIGDALTKLPGVSATSFTPGASRPVLRGFQGERVRVLTDGIGTIDVSNTSPDHAVTIDPLTIDRIEVLRGPAVLLFGGSAVGGAVNAIDKRIPRDVPDEPIHIDALIGYGSAADDRSASASVDAPLTDRLVIHFDGSYRKTGDLDVGGFVLSPGLRAEQLEIAEEEAEEGHFEEAEEALELANLRGRIPNTATETYSFGGGIAFIDEGGSLGIAASYYDSNYGVPARPGAEHAHESEDHDDDHDVDHEDEDEHGHEDPVTIGLKQLKIDFRGEVVMEGAFEALRLRAAYADFEQIEFEGDEVGTVFTNQGIEGRLELVQAENNGWRGASGIQYVFRDFSAVGAEAFVPPNITNQFGVFTLQELNRDAWEIEAALRYDRSHVEAKTLGVDRNFNSLSFAFGGAFKPASGLKIGANLTRSERAPSAEELFANGPHIATQAFEIGNPDLTTEKSWGGELYVRYDKPDFSLSATAFGTDFDNFIIDLPTGMEEDGLPVFQIVQNDARFYGFEGEVSATLARVGEFKIVADGVVDYVHAKLKGIGPVPRIPPLRLLGGLEAQSDTISARAEVEWFADQSRNAAFESETDGFTLVNASVSWKPLGKRGGVTLLASANNIFDVVGRRAASFTKDFAPLPGRDFRVSAKFSF